MIMMEYINITLQYTVSNTHALSNLIDQGGGELFFSWIKSSKFVRNKTWKYHLSKDHGLSEETENQVQDERSGNQKIIDQIKTRESQNDKS